MKVIVDSGPLIALGLARRLDLLPRIYGRIHVPSVVVREVTARPDDAARALLEALGEWAEVFDVTPDPDRPPSLGRVDLGELAVLAAAWDARPDAIAVLDDRRARRKAVSIGLRVLGTVGVLTRAKREGLIPVVRPEIERMRERGLYVDVRWLDAVLAAIGE